MCFVLAAVISHPCKGLRLRRLALSLLTTYAVWALVIASLYPACRWFVAFKQRRRGLAWLSYF